MSLGLMVSQQILVGGEDVRVRARKAWGIFPGISTVLLYSGV